jgi:hypothetical protein
MQDVTAEVHRRQLVRRGGAGSETPAEPRKVGTSLPVEDRDDTVEHGTPATPNGSGRGDVGETLFETAGHLPLDANGPARVEEEQRPGSIPVDAEQPIAIIERLGAGDRRLDRYVPGELGRRRGSKGQRIAGLCQGGT